MLDLHIPLTAPDPAIRLAFGAVWATTGASETGDIGVSLGWAAIGLCTSLGDPAAHGWDLLAYGRHVEELATKWGATLSIPMVSEAVQLAISGEVVTPGAEVAQKVTDKPLRPSMPPPPPGASVEALQAYHTALADFNAATRAGV